MPARLHSSSSSFSTSAIVVADKMRRRGITIAQHGRIRGHKIRIASLIRRRARLRGTALVLSLRELITVSLAGPSATGMATRTQRRPATLTPCMRTARNSSCRRRRVSRENGLAGPRLLGVPASARGISSATASGHDKALAALLTAAPQDRSARARGHAGAKSQLPLAGAIRGLECAFHDGASRELNSPEKAQTHTISAAGPTATPLQLQSLRTGDKANPWAMVGT